MPPEPDRDSVVTLREINRENLRAILDLAVAPDQERFVASNAVSIAQAHFEGDAAWFRAIYADETPVGFVMLEEHPGTAEYFLWRLMIDRRFQRLGIGKRAIALLIEHVRTRPRATELGVSCGPGEGGPYEFYRRLGFVLTGETHEGEVVLRLDLTGRVSVLRSDTPSGADLPDPR